MSAVGSRGKWVRLIAVVVLVLVACSGNKPVHTHFVCHIDIGGKQSSLSVNVARATGAQTTLVVGSPLRGDRSSVRHQVEFSVQGTAQHRLARIAVSVARVGDANATRYGTRSSDEGAFPFAGTLRLLAQYASPVAYDCPVPT